MEPETSKFFNQFSAYTVEPLGSVILVFFHDARRQGQKIHSNAKARTRNSADINAPWKYCALKQAQSRNFINRSTRLLVRCARS